MARKTFPYAVIYGGKIIPANTPIEVAEPKTETEKKPTKKKAVTKNDEGTNTES